jgi:hypothetical protein
MAKSALAVIDAAVAEAASQHRLTWIDRLPDEARNLMLAAREKFQAGGYGELKRLTLARILHEHAEKQGWKVADPTRLAEWLAKHD